jgi:hypothetical protein
MKPRSGRKSQKSDDTLRWLGARDAAALLGKPSKELEARQHLRQLQTEPGRRRNLQGQSIAKKALLAAIKKNRPCRGLNLWKQAVAMTGPVNQLLKADGWPKVTIRQIYYRLNTCPELFE